MTKFLIVAVRTSISEFEIDGDPLQNIQFVWSSWESYAKNHVSWGVREWYYKRHMLHLEWKDADGETLMYQPGDNHYTKIGARGFIGLPPQQNPLPFKDLVGFNE